MKKTTQELIELMRSSENYSQYRKTNDKEIIPSFMKIDRALTVIINEQGYKKSDIIAKSGIETHYAYQILSGAKTPTRDKVVMFCFGLGLTVEETQQLLKVTGYPQLYGKTERDNVILFGLTKQLSVIDLNDILYDLNLDLLI